MSQIYKIIKNNITENIYLYLTFSVIFLSLATGACQYMNEKLGLEDDNEAEEFIEVIIQSQTGVGLDLTPNSTER